jgi:NAD-dependent deacetylase
VVWFHETLPAKALSSAFEIADSCEIFFSIGTSALVQPAASLPTVARQAGAITFEINAAPTPLTRQMTYVLEGKAGEILPALVKTVWG